MCGHTRSENYYQPVSHDHNRWQECGQFWCQMVSIIRGKVTLFLTSIRFYHLVNHMFLLATDSVIIIWIALYEYDYDVVFRKKLSYSYFTRIKIRVDTTLYQYDLVCIRPEKIKWGRISYLLVFVPYNFNSYSYWSYRIRPRIRYDLIRPGRISDPWSWPGIWFFLYMLNLDLAARFLPHNLCDIKIRKKRKIEIFRIH